MNTKLISFMLVLGMIFSGFLIFIPDNVKATLVEDFDYVNINGNTEIEISGYHGYDTNIVIPDMINSKPVTKIGDVAFYQKNFTSVVIPYNITSIGKYAFGNCVNLTAISIPESVMLIDDYAFVGCVNLLSINIPYNIQFIGMASFQECSSITSIIINGNTNLNLEYTFYKCYSLKTVIIIDGLLKIGNGTFASCTDLEFITLPDSITSIGNWTFQDCTSLNTITIPENITSLGKEIFLRCNSLNEIIFNGNAPSVGPDWAKDTNSSLVAYYYDGNTGFTDPWNGVNTSIIYSYIPVDEWTNDRTVEMALLILIMSFITLFNYIGYSKVLYLLQILAFLAFIFVLVPLWPNDQISELLVFVFGIGNIGLLVGGVLK